MTEGRPVTTVRNNGIFVWLKIVKQLPGGGEIVDETALSTEEAHDLSWKLAKACMAISAQKPPEEPVCVPLNFSVSLDKATIDEAVRLTKERKEAEKGPGTPVYRGSEPGQGAKQETWHDREKLL